MSERKSDPRLERSLPSLAASTPRLEPSEPSLGGSDPPRHVAHAQLVDRRPLLGFEDSPKRAKPSLKAVSEAQLWAYLGQQATQNRISRLVSWFVSEKTPAFVVEEIAQEANIAAMMAKSRPRSTETMAAWLRTVVRRAVCHHFRAGASDQKWLNRDEDVEEVGAEPVESPGDLWLIGDWLRPAVAHDERDQETFELIGYKARGDKTDQEVADEHGMTYAAWTSRLSRFKKKYEPRWRRRERALLLLRFGGAAVVLTLVAYVLWRLLSSVSPAHAPLPAPPPPVSAEPAPAPTPSEEPFMPADPTHQAKPRRRP
jgi:DNA-directed RNA polymerase specialized sigma24 family protein